MIKKTTGERIFAFFNVIFLALFAFTTLYPFIYTLSKSLSTQAAVMNNVYFPVNWEDRWPEFARDIKKYQKEGKNEHDDGPDSLTGVYENPKPLGQWLY